jgi:hypothetical protein
MLKSATKLIFFIFLFTINNTFFCQNSINTYVLVCADFSDNLPLYFIDGLILDTFRIKNVHLEPYCVKRIKKDAYFKTENFDGKIEIFTKSLVDLDASLISKNKDKVKILSQIGINSVESISFVKKEEAMLLYCKKVRFGAIIIKIRGKKII